MSDSKIKINGTECALADFLFTKVRFDTPQFSRFMSLQPGDSGLNPGKLLFTEELEKFSEKPYHEILTWVLKNGSWSTYFSIIHINELYFNRK